MLGENVTEQKGSVSIIDADTTIQTVHDMSATGGVTQTGNNMSSTRKAEQTTDAQNVPNSTSRSGNVISSTGETTQPPTTRAEEICNYAFAGELPDGAVLTAPERALYYAVREMYDLYKKGRINAQTGAERKRAAIRLYNRDVTETEGNKQLIRNQGDYWRRVELVGERYALIRTKPADTIESMAEVIAAADNLFEVVYGVELARMTKTTQKGSDTVG